jgi:hypothetical protein
LEPGGEQSASTTHKAPGGGGGTLPPRPIEGAPPSRGASRVPSPAHAHLRSELVLSTLCSVFRTQTEVHHHVAYVRSPTRDPFARRNEPLASLRAQLGTEYSLSCWGPWKASRGLAGGVLVLGTHFLAEGAWRAPDGLQVVSAALGRFYGELRVSTGCYAPVLGRPSEHFVLSAPTRCGASTPARAM